MGNFLGGIGTALGILVTLFGIWRALRSKLRIRARADASLVRLPDDLEREFNSWLQKSNPSAIPIFNLRDVNLYTRVIVSNMGRREVNDLILTLPSAEGFYQVAKSVAAVKPLETDIKLGTLRAKDEVVIEIWTPSWLQSNMRKLRVTHSGDYVAVQSAERVFGPVGHVLAFLEPHPLILLIFVVWWIFSVFAAAVDFLHAILQLGFAKRG